MAGKHGHSTDQSPKMKADDFRRSPAGRLIPTIEESFAFVSHPLPPDRLDLTPLIPQVAKASQAVGELNGIGRTLSNSYLLIRPLQRREALSSSTIEGTFTTMSDLLLLEAGAAGVERPQDTLEVLNYVRALERSIDRLPELPISTRLIREAHRTLLEGVGHHRGAGIQAGELKRDQNWIGGKGTISTARFVPPPPKQAEDALGELEKYIHREQRDTMPALIDAALVHYQFEAIHPFPDGNGRIGRMLITLMLIDRQVLTQPLLYMSPFFEMNKDHYIDLMFEVSKSGAWLPWLSFFLNGVIESCSQTVRVIERLQALQKQYRDRLQRARSSVLILRIVDLAFERPARSVSEIAQVLGISYQGAANNIRVLIDEGIAHDAGMRFPRVIIFPQIIDCIHAPAS